MSPTAPSLTILLDVDRPAIADLRDAIREVL